jgi:hypothetical protein
MYYKYFSDATENFTCLTALLEQCVSTNYSNYVYNSETLDPFQRRKKNCISVFAGATRLGFICVYL